MVYLFIFINSLKQVYLDYLFSFSVWSTKGYLFNFLLTFTMMYLVIAIVMRLKYKKVILSLLIFLQTAYYLVNITYFEYFHNYLYFGTLLSNVTEGSELAAKFAIPLYQEQLLVLIDLPIFIYLIVKNLKIEISKIKLLITSLFICGLIFTAYFQNKLPINIYNDRWAGTLGVVQKYGLLTLQITDFVLNKNDEIKFEYGEILTSDNNKNEISPNVIMIQVESLDAGIVGLKYNNEEITPYLNSLSNKSVFYPYTMSYHLAGASSDSEFSVINGAHPLKQTPAIKLSHYKFENSFVKIFKDNGYETLAFHNNDAKFYNRGWSYPQMGYIDFLDFHKMHIAERIWGANDEDLFRFMTNKVKNAKKPFLYHIITMSSHEPFNFVPEYVNHKFDSVADEKTRNYFNSIQYTERQIENFLKSIDLSNTIVLIYGDHTNGIKEKDFTSVALEYDGKYFEFVPLFIITPDKQIYKETGKVASFMDVAPTILSFSGLKFSYKTFGENIFDKNMTKKVKFLGADYDRKDLYEKINAQNH